MSRSYFVPRNVSSFDYLKDALSDINSGITNSIQSLSFTGYSLGAPGSNKGDSIGLFYNYPNSVGGSPVDTDCVIDIPGDLFDSAFVLCYADEVSGTKANVSSYILNNGRLRSAAIVGDVYNYRTDAGVSRQRISFRISSSFASTSGDKPVKSICVFFRRAYRSVTQPSLNDTFVDIYSVGSKFSSYRGDFYNNKNRFNSLRFRCYESIYNAFYRDARNNPFYKQTIGGTELTPSYNEYLSFNDGGLDKNRFSLYKRNWEFDPYTSAVPSPQQGTAPLVGISSLGDVTFKSSEDGKTYTFSSETAPDADTITNIKVTSDVPNDVARAIVNTATQGISINDFRNVNAMQKWLETNIRRGLKIKDQTLARWGVDVKESILDMPEFIGGFSVPIEINQISQTSETETAPLGMYAGQGTGFGGSKHDVNCYCDQHGYIMAIVSVVPAPLYDQLIDKDFYKSNCLDYYNPEFGQIGMQPVYKKEVAPLSTATANLESVFGYQRPWYDYLYKADEIHGLFRSELRNFVLGRNFTTEPSLNKDFTTIDHNQLNNIFSVDKSDKILGQIRFNVTASRPIPSTHVPNLG